MIGIANGTVEAACNPLVATIYSDDKTTKLNHFHLWFPGGIVIGTLFVYFLDKAGIGWQVQVGLMLIPTLIIWIAFQQTQFPGYRKGGQWCITGEMYRSLLNPLVHLHDHSHVRYGHHRIIYRPVDRCTA
jgi:MFS family permease